MIAGNENGCQGTDPEGVATASFLWLFHSRVKNLSYTSTGQPLPEGSPSVTQTPPPELAVTNIDSSLGWRWADVVEMWRFRELFFYLTLRDIRLRYKQTILGLGWSIFQPLATIIVFVVFIGYMGKAAQGVDNYTLFVMAGVLPWTFFASAVSNSGNSLVNNERLVTKTYFPRLALPAANVFAAFFDLCICLVILAVAMALFGVAPTWKLALLPVIVGILGLYSMGVGVFLSALIASQRDFRFLLNLGLQLWMFATSCIYLPPETIPEAAKPWLPLNPVYGLVLNFRASVLGSEFDWVSLAVSAVATVITLAISLVYFRRVERTLADTI